MAQRESQSFFVLGTDCSSNVVASLQGSDKVSEFNMSGATGDQDKAIGYFKCSLK
jgi:hypothetical protein